MNIMGPTRESRVSGPLGRHGVLVWAGCGRSFMLCYVMLQSRLQCDLYSRMWTHMVMDMAHRQLYGAVAGARAAHACSLHQTRPGPAASAAR